MGCREVWDLKESTKRLGLEETSGRVRDENSFTGEMGLDYESQRRYAFWKGVSVWPLESRK